MEYVSDVDCKHYVLSPCAKEGVNPQLAEIVTMFALDIDANYYQGKTVDEDGLTYLEKYTYDFAQHTDIENDGSTAYVIMEDELYLFSEDDYFIAQFGRFYALTPR